MKTIALFLFSIFAFAFQTNAQENPEINEWSITCEDAQNNPSYLFWIDEVELTLACAEEGNHMLVEGTPFSISPSDSKKLGNISKIAVDAKAKGEDYRITKVTYRESASDYECIIEFFLTNSDKKRITTASIKKS